MFATRTLSRKLLRNVHRGVLRSCTSGQDSQPPSQKQHALLDLIKQKICITGPITVADYMRMAIASPLHGYYSREHNIFGDKGDFITAPELTQLFGEMIGVWCYFELANTGHKDEWQLIESGPGTCQLMNDVMREEKFSVHLVETSDQLIHRQEKLLCDSSTEYVADMPHIKSNVTKLGIPIFWYRTIDDIPEKFSIFISNEFLDALPVHQFKRDERGNWHEVFVNLDANDNLCFMLSKEENLRTVGLLPAEVRNNHSISEWEISLDAGTHINQIADQIIRFGGFALIVDYGHDGSRRDFSLRAYSKHHMANPLENPGSNDITADVNFGYLKSLVADRTLVYGPVEQRHFLTQLGMGLRLKRLLKACKTDSERKILLDSYEMLISDNGMGKRFKVLSLFPKALEEILCHRGGPVGFSTTS